MGAESSKTEGSLENLLTHGEPITHFFYEYQGDRAVEPALLIEDAIILWHEHIYTNEVVDNSYLWNLAGSLVLSPGDTPMYSWVEWLRYRVTTGAFVPEQWDKRKPYPYKGLLISAIYLQEARRLCDEGCADRAWHILTIAYYHLGLNTGSSTSQNTVRAAQVLHAGRTEKVRALVLAALERIKKDESANSMEIAKDRVVDMLRAQRHQSPIKEWLDEFDTIVPENTKGRTSAKQKNDVLVRIRNMLDNWSLPSGPYPDVADAFSQFSKRKTRMPLAPKSERATSEDVQIEGSDYYLRLISHLEGGETLTMHLARGDEST